ncbi:TPA: phage regulatory protein/antirepressor Ant [Clostridioides difficile]|uniref:phage regulatory protein/antirepressor Ant n=1 Tax=Clostridioides difficile TaxID=1496 RepID=UPI0004494E41|nr:phage regulatory protein/antirepressor Ant [Clostridioides difficile]EZR30483.1 Rha family transcriptional regulator [Clostridioides difficile]MBH7578237.1 phage regulatory protein/antirepressor Ant [Clostridioides difficile]MDN9271382.1 phage antirepressor KilAC domain-containing protein [Clostridioides difficile]NIZ86784.1 Rha family transcriptional regulator [Clostridioides difficile]OFA37652.1 Rha family transcriptional regulator [Clostridioides difficile]
MKDLTIVKVNNKLTTDSRDIALMVEKEHKILLRDIRNYINQMEEANKNMSTDLYPSDYFIENTYLDDYKREKPCYAITKIGCDFIANKMTGIKGTAFTGIYTKRFDEMEKVLKEQQPKLPTTYKEALQHLIEQVEVNEKLQLESKIKDQVINELKPKADYTDTILKSDSLVTITQIAKDYGMSGTEMNKLLHKLKVQYKQSGQWLLYKEHQGKSYTHSDTIEIIRSNGTIGSKMTTKWTQKGRLFLYDLLRANNILPDIEKSDRQLSMLS